MPILNAEAVRDLICRTLDLLDNRLVDHGQRVAYFVACMLRVEGRASPGEYQNLCLLALLHDLGAFKTEEIDNMLRFDAEDAWAHAIYGYLFLRELSPLGHLAPAVLFHHLAYENLHRAPVSCAREAQILCAADRLDILLQTTDLSPREIRNRMRQGSGKRFDPAVVDLLLRADPVYHIFQRGPIPDIGTVMGPVTMGDEEIDRYLRMLVFTIDFRSQETAVHTVTTTCIATALARLMGLGRDDRRALSYGALLHDIGKVGIPAEILHDTGKLDSAAMAVMRTHVTLTEKILSSGVDPTVTRIAIRHHERLDGSGYPRGLTASDLTQPERILAVADVLSALGEVRSYKLSFPKETTLSIIRQGAKDGQLDPTVAEAVCVHYDDLMAEARTQSEPILALYRGISEEFTTLMAQYANIK